MSNGGTVGVIVISKHGHDKRQPYVVVEVASDKFVLVANGDNRPLSRPKRKNISHLWVTNRRTAATSDLEIKRALKEFEKGSLNE